MRTITTCARTNSPQVTTDPESNNPIYEGAGTITSDSLAGESLKQGGSFGAGSGAAASAQPSRSTNTNNTDTSGATVLQPAPDAQARQTSEGFDATAQLNAGMSSSSSDEAGGKAYNTTTGSGANAGAAPSYVTAAGDSSKPAGDNISEGGFDSSAPNASFRTDIGEKNDPGRAAIEGFQYSNAQAGGDAGAGPRQDVAVGDGQFGALGGDTSA